jgi:hypothetical protein
LTDVRADIHHRPDAKAPEDGPVLYGGTDPVSQALAEISFAKQYQQLYELTRPSADKIEHHD